MADFSIRHFASRIALEQAAIATLDEAFHADHQTPFAVMLTGGRTPLAVYEQLAARPVPANPALRILLSDERHVPESSPEHNGAKLGPLLDALAIDASRRVLVDTSLALDEAARDYHERLLIDHAPIKLGILGLGSDGHLASLFSDADLATTATVRAIAVRRNPGPDRVSVSVATLMAVRRLIFLVVGEEKRAIVEQITQYPQAVLAGRALQGHAQVELWSCTEDDC
ncbi:MAG: 6-phosphogluconolactonase [Verrucomicrobia bacterium]|nr:6-phosphogluconolactonase [Verrucomicrobiota bacterium]